ncbi:MAG TPA: site-specific DNA-methyltransferase [Desulfotignum sp.]|nr:site-specific DNA-methyltransferase [Desulfotignum sp.]
MQTQHQIIFEDSRDMGALVQDSIDLVVTSPPYPMIAMWDQVFAAMAPGVEKNLAKGKGPDAFEMMHRQLDRVWQETYRVLKPGGFACINIGDATRTLDSHFMLYPNHARIMSCLLSLGFTALPAVLWRKQTNAPNKFMGSGMLPAGAYVTLEHEYILVVRKGGKRAFKSPEAKQRRHESAFFWEERNQWFSDIWMDLKGTRQKTTDAALRLRSGAFPFELPYRLICMYSVKEDTVLDPFMGIGTTALAAMAAGRNSVGFEIETGFAPAVDVRTDAIVVLSNTVISQRLDHHQDFIKQRLENNKPVKHTNIHYNFPVITSQEKTLLLNRPLAVKKFSNNSFEVDYAEGPGYSEKRLKKQTAPARAANAGEKMPERIREGTRGEQLDLFDSV